MWEVSTVNRFNFISYDGPDAPLYRCKTFQGGATAFTSGIRFLNPIGATVALSLWSWGHQVNMGALLEYILMSGEECEYGGLWIIARDE